jgi:hypothetical protein
MWFADSSACAGCPSQLFTNLARVFTDVSGVRDASPSLGTASPCSPGMLYIRVTMWRYMGRLSTYHHRRVLRDSIHRSHTPVHAWEELETLRRTKLSTMWYACVIPDTSDACAGCPLDSYSPTSPAYSPTSPRCVMPHEARASVGCKSVV